MLPRLIEGSIRSSRRRGIAPPQLRPSSYAGEYRQNLRAVGGQTSPLQVVEEKSFDIAPPNSVKPGYGGIHHTMSKLKVTLAGLMLPLALFGSPHVDSHNLDTKNNNNGYAQSGTLQKMIVEDANVSMQLDLNGLNGSNSLVARPVTLQFSVAANSFFPILVFNDLLRGAEPGSMALIPQNVPALPARLKAQGVPEYFAGSGPLSPAELCAADR